MIRGDPLQIFWMVLQHLGYRLAVSKCPHEEEQILMIRSEQFNLFIKFHEIHDFHQILILYLKFPFHNYHLKHIHHYYNQQEYNLLRNVPVPNLHPRVLIFLIKYRDHHHNHDGVSFSSSFCLSCVFYFF